MLTGVETNSLLDASASCAAIVQSYAAKVVREADAAQRACTDSAVSTGIETGTVSDGNSDWSRQEEDSVYSVLDSHRSSEVPDPDGGDENAEPECMVSQQPMIRVRPGTIDSDVLGTTTGSAFALLEVVSQTPSVADARGGASPEGCAEDVWASQVLGSLKAPPSCGSPPLDALDRAAILEALGCQHDSLGSLPSSSSATSSPLAYESATPAAGLRRSPSACTVDPEVLAAVHRSRSAVPGLQMSKVKMGDEDDEDTEDEQALLLSALNPSMLSPSCAASHKKLADVPQLNMLALQSRGGEDDRGSSPCADTIAPKGGNITGPPSCTSTGVSGPWAPRRGSLRGSSSLPVLSSSPNAPASVSPHLHSSSSACAALVPSAIRRGPSKCPSVTVRAHKEAKAADCTSVRTPAVNHRGMQLPSVGSPSKQFSFSPPAIIAQPDRRQLDSAVTASATYQRTSRARRLCKQGLSRTAAVWPSVPRQGRLQSMAPGSLGASAWETSSGATGRSSSLGAFEHGGGPGRKRPFGMKAPLHVHHHVHYHVMRPSDSGAVTNKAGQVLP